MTSRPDRRLRVGGTLDPERDIYIVRPQDDEIFDALRAGEYVAILESRQQGKSSAMRYAAMRLRAIDVAVADVDMAGTLGTIGATTDQWYTGLLRHIVRQLGLRVDVRAWWQEHCYDTLSERLHAFFRDVLLAETDMPIVIFLDEIDCTLELEPAGAADDLFICLRAMYNERGRESAFERLTFCLLGVARPNELIQRRRITPYNIGKHIELRDFRAHEDDLTPLAAALAAGPEAKTDAEPTDGHALLDEILAWTDGHPYLTLALCQRCVEDDSCATPADVTRLIEDEFADPGHARRAVHFASVARIFDQRAGIGALALYRRVLAGRQVRAGVGLDASLLELSGLVKRGESGHLEVRNPIYARVFDRRWLRQTEPAKTLRYLRWAMAFVLLNALAVAAWIAYQHLAR